MFCLRIENLFMILLTRQLNLRWKLWVLKILNFAQNFLRKNNKRFPIVIWFSGSFSRDPQNFWDRENSKIAGIGCVWFETIQNKLKLLLFNLQDSWRLLCLRPSVWRFGCPGGRNRRWRADLAPRNSPLSRFSQKMHLTSVSAQFLICKKI